MLRAVGQIEGRAYLDDAVHHVSDEGLGGLDLGSLLVAAEPHAEADVVAFALVAGLLHNAHLDAHVGKVPGN